MLRVVYKTLPIGVDDPASFNAATFVNRKYVLKELSAFARRYSGFVAGASFLIFHFSFLELEVLNILYRKVNHNFRFLLCFGKQDRVP